MGWGGLRPLFPGALDGSRDLLPEARSRARVGGEPCRVGDEPCRVGGEPDRGRRAHPGGPHEPCRSPNEPRTRPHRGRRPDRPAGWAASLATGGRRGLHAVGGEPCRVGGDAGVAGGAGGAAVGVVLADPLINLTGGRRGGAARRAGPRAGRGSPGSAASPCRVGGEACRVGGEACRVGGRGLAGWAESLAGWAESLAGSRRQHQGPLPIALRLAPGAAWIAWGRRARRFSPPPDRACRAPCRAAAPGRRGSAAAPRP